MAYEPQDPISNLSLYQSTWRLLGLDLDTLDDVPPDAPRDQAPEARPPAADTSVAAAPPEGSGGVSDDLANPEDSTTEDSAGRAPLTEGRFIPLPGAPALAAGEPQTFAVAAGVVGLVTGATVYAVGGVGLSVPWTIDQAPAADPLFLGGIGTATFIVTSVVANQVLVKVTSKRGQAGRIQFTPSPQGIALKF